MIWLTVYLCVGLVTLVAMYVVHLLKKPADDALTVALKKGAGVLERVVIPAIVVPFVILVWPLAVFWKAKDIVEARRPRVEQVPAEFTVTPSDLLTRTTVAAVEAFETVHDPLYAVPDLPFGHLHGAWENFIEGFEANDELWSFTAPGRQHGGAWRSEPDMSSYMSASRQPTF